MEKKNYSYQLISQKHHPVFGNTYLYEQGNKIVELVLIGQAKPYLYFIKFLDLTPESVQVISYFNGDLQDEQNIDFDWISTKFLLKYMDEITGKKIIVQEINSVDKFAFVTENETEAIIFKINEAVFKDVAFIKEITKADNLELVSKLLELDKRAAYLSIDENLIADLNDSQAYLLDSIYDNE